MSRDETDAPKVERLMAALGRRASGPGAVYFTGGVSAVLLGWRSATVDADLLLDPEPGGVFEAIARIKDELSINIELASPADFIPELPGWRERSRFVAQHGPVAFFHYDFRAQALAKLERGHARDLDDVRAMLRRGLVTRDELAEAFAKLVPHLIRYPAIDAEAFRTKVERFLAGEAEARG